MKHSPDCLTPPAILQVLPALYTGGVERGTVEIAAALAAKGIPPLVASSGGGLVRELKYLGASHHTLPLASKNPLTLYRNGQRLEKIIETHGVGLVHARSRAPAWSARAAARKAGIPFLTTYHGTYAMTGLPFKRHYNSIMASGDMVIAISHFVKKYIETHHPEVPESALTVIHRGVDTAVFAPEAVPAARIEMLREAWNIPDNAFVILLAGRLTSWKGQRLLLEALAQLPSTTRPWVALLTGSPQGRDAYLRSLQQQAIESGIAANIRFTGQCDDMPAAYCLADVMVSASTRPEAFGRVITEAQAMQCPVIATNHGGAAESIIPDRTGWLFDATDTSALCHLLQTVMAMESTARQQIGMTARAHVSASFSLQSMQEKTLEIYERLLSGERPRQTAFTARQTVLRAA